jgi:hypothetical protein
MFPSLQDAARDSRVMRGRNAHCHRVERGLPEKRVQVPMERGDAETLPGLLETVAVRIAQSHDLDLGNPLERG